MDTKKQLEILKKWFAKQLVRRVFFVEEKKVSIDANGNEVVEIIKKKKVMVVAPSTKSGINRTWYLVLPNKKTISYTEPKVKDYNPYVKDFVVNNTTKKPSEILKFLYAMAYKTYGLDYEKVVNDNIFIK